MILAICMLGVGGALLAFAPALLERGTGHTRSPLAKLIAWQLASWTALVSLLLASTLLAIPALAAAGRLPANVESCLAVLRDVPNPADSGTVQAVAGAALALAILRLCGCALLSAATNHRNRARHRVLLCLLGTADVEMGAHVVANPAALAYCLPGHGGSVVFTSGALAKLDPTQRAAVLAHERAHLRGRHHLLIASASILTRAFPRIALFRRTLVHTTELVEMRADDVAARRCGPRPIAAALLNLADMTQSATVLAATGVTTANRIARLLEDPQSDHVHATRAVGTAVGAILIAGSPFLLAAVGHAALCLF